MPPTARVLHLPSNRPTWVICGPDAPKSRRSDLESAGAAVITAPLQSGRIDLAMLMDLLGAKGITSLLIEGGAAVIGAAFAAEIVDKVCFIYAPKILGGDDGVPICRGSGPAHMQASISIHDLAVSRFGPDVLLQGYLKPQ
jgi:diaminohydroxyphosphoribosylaminopyrimidine deaminase / 5-amino-6-(5-phosphoribosylamino)uracil reductase